MRSFEYLHRVTFEETNLVGNVYYVNLLRWQGRCRELFLLRHYPEIDAELRGGLAVVTTRCSCEFLGELFAFDEVAVQMRLGGRTQNRVAMSFEYWRRRPGADDELVARGEQQVAFLRRQGDRLVPAPLPEPLANALDDYTVATPAAVPAGGGLR